MTGSTSGGKGPGAVGGGGAAEAEAARAQHEGGQSSVSGGDPVGQPAGDEAAPASTATDNTDARSSRPMSLTPGGGLAALFAKNRDRLAAGIRASRSTPATEAFDASEITAVGGAAMAPRATPEKAPETSPVDNEKTSPGADVRRLSHEVPRAGGLPPSDSFDSLEITAVEKTSADRGPVQPAAPRTTVDTKDAKDPTTGPQYVDEDEEKTTELAKNPSAGASPVEAAAPRPNRPTPGNDRLAALLAQARARTATGRHAILGEEKPIVSPPHATGVASDAPKAQRPSRSMTPSAVVSLARDKTPAFAATLMGVPAPHVERDGAAPSWRIAADQTVPNAEEWDRTPEPELTERNLETSGKDSRSFAWTAGTPPDDDRQRATETLAAVDGLRPSRGPRVAAGVVVLGGLAVLAVAFIAPRFRKVAAPGAVSTEAVPAPAPATPTPAPQPSHETAAPAVPAPAIADPEPPVRVPAPAAALNDDVGNRRPRQDDSAKGESARGGLLAKSEEEAPEKAKSNKSKKKAKTADSAGDKAPDKVQSQVALEQHAPSEATPPEPKRKAVARAEIPGAESRSGTKKRRSRSQEARSPQAEISGAGQSLPSEWTKSKASVPARPVESDPDGTLPLTGR
ncbi:MAG: hypothetical protein ABUS79_14385 [Pseudomonadota bacterium]